MIGRRATVGLSLLCALLFSVFAAESALATKGITGVTCSPTIEGEGEWKDAHCDTKVGAGKGSYEHVAIPTNPTDITITNAQTTSETNAAGSVTLKGTLVGVVSEVVCKTVAGTGLIENKAGPPMSVTGSTPLTLSNCTMPLPTNGGKDRCIVHEPITLEAEVESRNLSASPEEMSLNFKPALAGQFASLSFTEGPGGKCHVVGKPASLTGNLEATQQGVPNGSGATLVFTNAMTKGVKCGEVGTTGLCWGGKAAELSSTITFKMAKEQNGKEYPENAISFTTFAT